MKPSGAYRGSLRDRFSALGSMPLGGRAMRDRCAVMRAAKLDEVTAERTAFVGQFEPAEPYPQACGTTWYEALSYRDTATYRPKGGHGLDNDDTHETNLCGSLAPVAGALHVGGLWCAGAHGAEWVVGDGS